LTVAAGDDVGDVLARPWSCPEVEDCVPPCPVPASLAGDSWLFSVALPGLVSVASPALLARPDMFGAGTIGRSAASCGIPVALPNVGDSPGSTGTGRLLVADFVSAPPAGSGFSLSIIFGNPLS
jgi:hypothetical protein